MKILVVGNDGFSFKAFRTPMIVSFKEAGYDVLACGAEFTEEYIQHMKSIDIPYIEMPLERNSFNPLKDIKTLIWLFKLIRNVKPDIVLAYSIKPVLYSSLLTRITRIGKMFSMIPGLGYAFSEGGGIKQRIIRFIAMNLYRVILRNNKGVVFQNEESRTLFTSKILKNSTDTIRINGSGVDLNLFKPAPYPEEIRFLFIGRLINEKGCRLFHDAAEHIKQKHPHVSFSIVGGLDSNPRSITKKELDEWSTKGIIENRGKVFDIKPEIARASVFVLPSHYPEGVPKSILESMAMGRPIITTDWSGCRDTVKDGVNGWLITPKNLTELIEKMEFFINTPESIHIFGTASRNYAEEKFNVDHNNAQIIQLFKQH